MRTLQEEREEAQKRQAEEAARVAQLEQDLIGVTEKGLQKETELDWWVGLPLSGVTAGRVLKCHRRCPHETFQMVLSACDPRWGTVGGSVPRPLLGNTSLAVIVFIFGQPQGQGEEVNPGEGHPGHTAEERAGREEPL